MAFNTCPRRLTEGFVISTEAENASAANFPAGQGCRPATLNPFGPALVICVPASAGGLLLSTAGTAACITLAVPVVRVAYLLFIGIVFCHKIRFTGKAFTNSFRP